MVSMNGGNMSATFKDKLKNDEHFLGLCEKVGLPKEKHKTLGLKRQYSKYLRKRGLAHTKHLEEKND
jgi:hypothetical protein